MSVPKRSFVAVAGIMGVGKTTAAKLLSERLGLPLLLEGEDENIFLPKMYQEPSRWAVSCQLWYLSERVRNARAATAFISKNGGVVQDCPVQQDLNVYVAAQRVSGNITEEEYQLYRRMYESVLPFMPVPAFIVNLTASLDVVRERIRTRDRDCENQVTTDYLALLQALNHHWAKDAQILTIDTTNRDLVACEKDQESFVDTVRMFM